MGEAFPLSKMALVMVGTRMENESGRNSGDRTRWGKMGCSAVGVRGGERGRVRKKSKEWGSRIMVCERYMQLE